MISVKPKNITKMISKTSCLMFIVFLFSTQIFADDAIKPQEKFARDFVDLIIKGDFETAY